MNRADHYRQYFTKDYLMGPNSFRLLDELIRRNPYNVRWDRTLDLGCGMALTSVFLANETPAKSVYAFDLWVSATENLKRIRDLSLEDRIVPIHGDALDMPFAQDWFDTVVSVDSYHYFGCKEGVSICGQDPALCPPGRLCNDCRSRPQERTAGRNPHAL